MRSILGAAALLALLGGPHAAQAAKAGPAGLFGMAEFRSDSHAALPKWRQLLRAAAMEEPVLQACARRPRACPDAATTAWMALLHDLDDAPPAEQIRAVNSFVNRSPYREDGRNYGRRDHWATPLEFMRHSGDCEDYAITKYYSLRHLGFAADQLRLVVVRDKVREMAHAVLAVYLGDEVLILDNLTDAIMPEWRIAHYVPYYSVNEIASWAHMPRNAIIVANRRPAAWR